MTSHTGGMKVLFSKKSYIKAELIYPYAIKTKHAKFKLCSARESTMCYLAQQKWSHHNREEKASYSVQKTAPSRNTILNWVRNFGQRGNMENRNTSLRSNVVCLPLDSLFPGSCTGKDSPQDWLSSWSDLSPPNVFMGICLGWRL